WENFDLLDERLFPADFVAAAHELRRHRADLVGWQAGLRRLPTIRATGRPEHHAGWNRLLWGPERVYRGGWQITSMTSRRAAPRGRAIRGPRSARQRPEAPTPLVDQPAYAGAAAERRGVEGGRGQPRLTITASPAAAAPSSRRSPVRRETAAPRRPPAGGGAS